MVIPWPQPDEEFPGRPNELARPADADERLAGHVVERLRRDARTSQQHISVEVQNRVAVLTGWVDSEEAAQAAADQAWQTSGIVDVCNTLDRRDDDDLAGM